MQDIRLVSQSEEGLYAEDPYVDVHPEVLERYYGVDRHGAAPDQALNEQADAAAGLELDLDHLPPHHADVEDDIAADVGRNVRHEPIQVANHASPFATDQETVHFLTLLDTLDAEDYLPLEYGLAPQEWEGGRYPEAENIRMGTRGDGMTIPLPLELWYPRAVKWGRALDVLSRILDHDEQHGGVFDAVVEEEP